jgi:hypothetical protein
VISKQQHAAEAKNNIIPWTFIYNTNENKVSKIRTAIEEVNRIVWKVNFFFIKILIEWHRIKIQQIDKRIGMNIKFIEIL